MTHRGALADDPGLNVVEIPDPLQGVLRNNGSGLPVDVEKVPPQVRPAGCLADLRRVVSFWLGGSAKPV